MNLKLIHFGLVLAGAVAVWLILWDFIAFLTTGFNDGIWNWTIVQNGFPSIIVGIILLFIVGYYGVRSLI